MPSTPRSNAAKAVVAVALFLLGLVCAGLYRVIIGTEHHAYATSAVAPDTVHLTTGQTYQLSVPGGVHALQKRGADVSTARCSYRVGGGPLRELQVQASGPGTKATNTVGTFVAQETGDTHIDCFGWTPLFVDDSDDAATDVAGGLLVLGVILLTAGLGLGLSALRAAGGDADESAWAAREDDEIQRLVNVVHVRSRDQEVGGADGDDVLT